MKELGATINTWKSKEHAVWHGGFFVIIGCALLTTLSFETSPLPIRVQIMPLASLLALLFLPFALRRIFKTPLITAVALFAGYALIHSAVGLFIDAVHGEPLIRLISWLRQVAALIAGVSLFIVMRKALLHLSERQIVRYVILGTLPSLILAVLTILWGALRQAWAGNIVVAIRSFVAPLGHTSSFRASGFSLEPATLASYLAIVMMPLLFVLFGYKEHRRLAIVVLILTVLAFVWTFSTTGLIILFTIFFAGLIFGPRRGLIMKTSLVLIVMVVTALTLFPNNQIFRHARSLAAGKSNLSFNDRFYGAVGPFLNSFSSYTMLGYGLGGTVSHFEEMVPQSVQAEILAAKWKNLPNLATLFGRIFAEIGALGFAFFLLIIGLTFWELRMVLRIETDRHKRLLLASARLGLFGAFFSLTFAFGSFHIPYFWFWMAFVDSRYALRQNSALAKIEA